ncbi:hypothetical protein F4819DRAFT_485857 [Hypoxylon fuscum]|nr:hypothetical protein F4819DRAFT_485857 [Hypoxylon fuscum]
MPAKFKSDDQQPGERLGDWKLRLKRKHRKEAGLCQILSCDRPRFNASFCREHNERQKKTTAARCRANRAIGISQNTAAKKSISNMRSDHDDSAQAPDIAPYDSASQVPLSNNANGHGNPSGHYIPNSCHDTNRHSNLNKHNNPDLSYALDNVSVDSGLPYELNAYILRWISNVEPNDSDTQSTSHSGDNSPSPPQYGPTVVPSIYHPLVARQPALYSKTQVIGGSVKTWYWLSDD